MFMRIIGKIIITLLLFMVTQAHAEYNAGVVTAAFANTPCRINTDLQPYAMVRNLGDIGSYKVLLEVYKSIALWPD